jgi:hypothetical protein
MSRRLSALALALLLLGACGGDEPEPEATPSPAEVSPTPSPSPEVSPSPSPTTPSPSPSPSPSPRRSPSPAAAPAPAQPALATGPARAGEYVFDQSGQIRTLGCLTSNQTPPSTARVRVAAPNGNRQQIERDQTGQNIGSLTTAVFEYRDDGAYLVSLKQTQTVAGQTVVLDFEANPPVLAIPSRPAPGQIGGFTLTSRDGQVRAETSSQIEALNEQVTLAGGASVRSHRIRTTTRITGNSPQGSLNINLGRVSWYAPDSHLEVKDRTDTTGTVGLCRVDFSVESIARSV